MDPSLIYFTYWIFTEGVLLIAFITQLWPIATRVTTGLQMSALRKGVEKADE